MSTSTKNANAPKGKIRAAFGTFAYRAHVRGLLESLAETARYMNLRYPERVDTAQIVEWINKLESWDS